MHYQPNSQVFHLISPKILKELEKAEEKQQKLTKELVENSYRFDPFWNSKKKAPFVPYSRDF